MTEPRDARALSEADEMREALRLAYIDADDSRYHKQCADARAEKAEAEKDRLHSMLTAALPVVEEYAGIVKAPRRYEAEKVALVQRIRAALESL